jgi:hypothetical protein
MKIYDVVRKKDEIGPTQMRLKGPDFGDKPVADPFVLIILREKPLDGMPSARRPNCYVETMSVMAVDDQEVHVGPP